jgi:nucleoside-diphosphate-sugar epimerase
MITYDDLSDGPAGLSQRVMRLLVTGGTGVLGRAFLPMAVTVGHQVIAPARDELDLFDPAAVIRAMSDVDAVIHLATRILPLDQVAHPEAWHENDRLRIEASRILVDAALEVGASVYVQPTVTFVYPASGPVDEASPVSREGTLRSSIIAEQETARFASHGGRGVVLRLGLLDGPGTGNEAPNTVFGATLHTADAGRAILAALTLGSGTYNVCRDDERVSNRRFSDAAGWHPQE